VKMFIGNLATSLNQTGRIKLYIFRQRLSHKIGFRSILRDHSSDSQRIGYEEIVAKLVSGRNVRNFRKSVGYQLILEHVNLGTGVKYANRIKELNVIEKSEIATLLESDVVGNPIKYNFKYYGKCSSTTLRYISVASEILSLGFSLDNSRIVEIGSGYGGQARIISSIAKPLSYTVYDLPSVQALNSYFLEKNEIQMELIFGDISRIEPKSYDLCISNYAFSELPYLVQQEYLDKILCNSSHGYMIMNSGRGNMTGRSFGKLSASQILAKIPNSRVLDEIPLTGPDNYVIVW
jgi:hypothetical protein